MAHASPPMEKRCKPPPLHSSQLVPARPCCLAPPHSSSFLLIPPHSSSFLLIPTHSPSLLPTPPRSSSLLLAPPRSSSLLLTPPRPRRSGHTRALSRRASSHSYGATGCLSAPPRLRAARLCRSTATRPRTTGEGAGVNSQEGVPADCFEAWNFGHKRTHYTHISIVRKACMHVSWS
jgi:hypothetical protein